jgi:hypothetical protein
VNLGVRIASELRAKHPPIASPPPAEREPDVTSIFTKCVNRERGKLKVMPRNNDRNEKW